MTDAALPKPRLDILPALAPLIVAAIAAPFVGSLSTFVTLTVASLAMGAMLFVMASGLTLAFGLMDVLNFGHGAFIAVGAFVATIVYGWRRRVRSGSNSWCSLRRWRRRRWSAPSSALFTRNC